MSLPRGSFIPVSDWAEEDSPAVASDIDRQLVTGTARNIAGYAITTINALAGLTTLTAGDDSPTSAIYNMITKLRVDADSEPNLIVMHPNKWANIVTEQAQGGDYLFSGQANMQIMMQRWGLPVIPDVTVDEDTVFVMDTDSVRFRDRRAVNIWTAPRWAVSSNLTVPTGQMIHACDARFAFYGRYPAGIGKIT